jgi:hypothetical protein
MRKNRLLSLLMMAAMLAAVVLLLQLGQLATLLFTTAAAYQLTDRYKA